MKLNEKITEQRKNHYVCIECDSLIVNVDIKLNKNNEAVCDCGAIVSHKDNSIQFRHSLPHPLYKTVIQRLEEAHNLLVELYESDYVVDDYKQAKIEIWMDNYDEGSIF